MTVVQLIGKLQEFELDARVQFNTYDEAFEIIDVVRGLDLSKRKPGTTVAVIKGRRLGCFGM